MGWQTQFNDDGFTDGDIDKLDAIVEEWISSIDLERLPALVSNIQDMGDESELEQAYNRCLGQVSNRPSVQTNLERGVSKSYGCLLLCGGATRACH